MINKNIFSSIISFLIGASWSIVILGALIVFKTFYILGLEASIFLTLLYIFTSLFLVLLLNSFSVNRDRLAEAKKHTELLEKIASQATQKQI